ncbi:SpnB-like Rossmann fold domain-containing protein, partial [Mycobacterium avium]|uniref:SpnB-like Rossmann fold domain-containing protein n=1 Tax=Mycobacterium avium TaxID=1764 RepID=UPI000A790C79
VHPGPAGHRPELVLEVQAARVAEVYAATRAVLPVLQSWLARDGAGTLVVSTRGAMTLPGEDVTDLAGAAVWGLVRHAQTAHPGR